MKTNSLLARFDRRLSTFSPWRATYAWGRTLLALAMLSTLLLNTTDVLFIPTALEGASLVCSSASQRASIFCWLPSNLELARWLCIAGLMIVASGWRPRVTGILHWWIAHSIHSCVIPIDGGDQAAKVITLLLIPLTLMDHRSSHWVKELTSERQSKTKSTIALISVGLIQLQVAGIYFHAALAKTHVEEWADGTAMYYILSNSHFGLPASILEFAMPLLSLGWFCALLTWSVVILEFALAFSCFFSPRGQRLMFGLGIALHLGILVFQGISSFSVTMCALLIFFLCNWSRWEPHFFTANRHIPLLNRPIVPRLVSQLRG